MSTRPTRIFIITGDHSGDVHAAKVVRHLRTLEPGIEIEAVGGAALKQEGVPLLADQEKMGAVGFGAFLSAPYHYLLGKKILKRLQTFRPDAVLHIDYGVFNLWMARQVRQMGIKTFYFIPPQLWASRQGRIRKIQAGVDHVFCIFPFEEPFYRSHNVPVTYVGHPLIGELPPPADKTEFCRRHGLDPEKPIIGIMPGSRKMEIDYLLKPCVQAIPHIRKEVRNAQFVIARAPSLKKAYFDAKLLEAVRATQPVPCVHTVENENHALMSVADAMIVKSGTGTLEAALYKKPMIVIYRGHFIAYQIMKRVVYVKVMGLPNLLTSQDDPIVRELLQYDCEPLKIAEAMVPLLDKQSEPYRKAMEGFEKIGQTLSKGDAAENLAREILAQLGTGISSGVAAPSSEAGVPTIV